jgi:hypothetical protein
MEEHCAFSSGKQTSNTPLERRAPSSRPMRSQSIIPSAAFHRNVALPALSSFPRLQSLSIARYICSRQSTFGSTEATTATARLPYKIQVISILSILSLHSLTTLFPIPPSAQKSKQSKQQQQARLAKQASINPGPRRLSSW